MRTRTLPLICALAGALALAAPTDARGAPPVETKVEAEALTDKAAALYDEGVALFKKSKWAEARASFLAAWSLKQHWQIAGNLADCELRLGRFREAAEHAAHYKRSAPADRKARAEALMKAAAVMVAAVTVTVEPAGAEVVIDGVSVGRAPLEGPVFLDPGERKIEARVPGRPEAIETRMLVAGSEVGVTLRVPEAVTAKPSVEQKPGGGERTPPPPPAVPVEERSVVPAIVLGGVAVVGLGVGIGLLAAGSSKDSDAEELNRSILAGGQSCVGGAGNFSAQCAELESTASSADTLHDAGVGVLIGAGVAAVGAGAYLLLWPAPAPASAGGVSVRAAPAVSGASRGVIVVGSF
ncbi:MAG: PEGA domain-containing protein [Polyangiaceae bacterium]|nr:PEGA domain-containing protein [Polyangiaceae bacterium]